jgi:hypothetical protein
MIKTFPKSRVCVIDCYTSFEQGLQKAYSFAKKHNLTLNSSDGQKLILGFCLKDIEKSYTSTKSQYPKVLCLSRKAINKKIEYFVNTHFDKMMEHLPIPYCGKYDLNSPDLEMAAEASLKQEKPQRKFNDFALMLKLKSN